jgi:type IV pilus assembly protein PilC
MVSVTNRSGMTARCESANQEASVKFGSKHLAAFYYQLGTLVQAGLPIQSALVTAQKTAPRPMRPTVATLAGVVNAGAPLHEAMERLERRFEALDRHCINMTERSGALDVGLLSLSKYYESLAVARRRIVDGMLYPGFLVAAAVFIPRFPALFLEQITVAQYLWQTAGLLARLALVGWMVSRLVRWALQTPGLNLAVDRVLRAVPVFGRLRYDYALSQWVSAIRLMLSAGIGIVPALESASRANPSPLIAAAYKKIGPLIGSQLDVSEALARTGEFPDHLVQMWATGEKSGRMDETLGRLATFYEERWQRSLDLVATWLPRIVYLVVVLLVAVQIVSGYVAYFNRYDELLR